MGIGPWQRENASLLFPLNFSYPMFVPSLSWQIFGSYSYKTAQKRVSRTQPYALPSTAGAAAMSPR
jgi:hypothetical protein